MTRTPIRSKDIVVESLRPYNRDMGTTPATRLTRLVRHARKGWQRLNEEPTARDRARTWLTAHPSPMPEVDRLWFECLDRRGPLAAWLEANADPDEWDHDLALHTVLASHPFADLPQWSVRKK